MRPTLADIGPLPISLDIHCSIQSTVSSVILLDFQPNHSQPTSAWNSTAAGVLFIPEVLSHLSCPLCGTVWMHFPPLSPGVPQWDRTLVVCNCNLLDNLLFLSFLSFPSHFSTPLLLHPGVNSPINSLYSNPCLKDYF